MAAVRAKKRKQSESEHRQVSRVVTKDPIDDQIETEISQVSHVATQHLTVGEIESELDGTSRVAAEDPTVDQNSHLPPVPESHCIEYFHQQIHIGPTLSCTCCSRLLFKSSMTTFNIDHFSDCPPDLLTQCQSSVANLLKRKILFRLSRFEFRNF